VDRNDHHLRPLGRDHPGPGRKDAVFDDFLLDAAGAGCHQVVLFAAGFDMRAFRLSWPNGIAVFELDHAEVMTLKQQVITGHGHHPTCRRVVVKANPADDWASLLVAAGFEGTRPTAWLAEGLLIYLDPDAKDRLLATITRLSSPRSRLAFDHLDRMRLDELRGSLPGGDAQGRAAAALWRSGLAEAPADWLDRFGWDGHLDSATERAARYGRTGTSAPPRGGSWLVTARLR